MSPVSCARQLGLFFLHSAYLVPADITGNNNCTVHTSHRLLLACYKWKRKLFPFCRKLFFCTLMLFISTHTKVISAWKNIYQYICLVKCRPEIGQIIRTDLTSQVIIVREKKYFNFLFIISVAAILPTYIVNSAKSVANSFFLFICIAFLFVCWVETVKLEQLKWT